MQYKKQECSKTDYKIAARILSAINQGLGVNPTKIYTLGQC